MRFPLHITTGTVKHQIVNALAGNKRYPFVLMLEPLYTCNLACLGCAIERHTGKLADRLPLEKCLEAVEISKAADRLDLRRRADDLPGAAAARRRDHPEEAPHLPLHERPPPRPEGLRRDSSRPPAHDQRAPGRHAGDARQGLRARRRLRHGRRDDPRGRRLGHHVMANMTIFKETDVAEVEEVCELLTGLGVEGLLVSPGYHYESVDARHVPDEVGDPEEIPAGARDLQEVQADVDADVPGVRRGAARVQVLALEHGDLHAERLEGARAT